VVTGHRAAAWLVPEECEYVHLPSLDSLFRHKAEAWGRKPFVEMGAKELFAFRTGLLASVTEAFKPDAIVVDHLPLGKSAEWERLLEESPARKYLVLRGVDEPEKVRKSILGGRAGSLLERKFDRVLVTCDPRVCDVREEYAVSPPLAAKVSHVGYVGEPVPDEEIERTRRERGLRPGDVWVVCSAGGGQLGERLAEECLRLSRTMPEPFVFDVIAGPKSRVGEEWRPSEALWEGRNRRMVEHRDLPLLHAAADAVVSAGGYNSIVEAMEGGAALLCVPVQREPGDEQYIHTSRLGSLYPLRVVLDLSRLGDEILSVSRNLERRRGRDLLNLDGLSGIRELVFRDLGI
jgi:predicted glycosyltransferase